MGLLAAFDQRIRNASYTDTEGWFANWLRGGEENDSGVSVNEANALKIATIWKCVNWRSKMFGMLPKKIFERVEIMGRAAQREARSHPLYPLIHTAPNPTITSKAWFGLISADIHLWGNSYAYIERARGTARIVALWRILPDAVRIEQDSAGNIRYFVRYGANAEEKFFPDEILHVRGLGFDGVRGYSPIQMERQTLAWSKATQQFSAKFYKNAFRPSGLLISPSTIKPEAKKGLIDNLKAQGKEGGLALIEGALEYKPLGIPQDDAQFIETMEFQEETLCGIMEVYPHEVGIMRNLTFNNVEQLTISSITRNLQPFAIDVEQWFDLQLLSDGPSTGKGGGTERDRFFHQCELKVLMRGDMAAQTAHIKEMIGAGVYSPNDGRDYVGLSPYSGGDVYVINRAYGPVDSIDEWTMTSQNNPPASPEPKKDPAKKSIPDHVRRMAAGLLRDAIGRVMHRPAKGRADLIPTIMGPAVLAVFECAELKKDGFALDYLGAMAQRCSFWKDTAIDAVVSEETERLIATVLEKL